MTRSYRKPYFTITPQWNNHAEKRFRQRVKQSLQGFDPDADWDEVNLSMKGLGEYGTKLGFDVPPDESGEFYEEDMEAYRKGCRK